MNDHSEPHQQRALTYSEMMNEGKQRQEPTHPSDEDLKSRVEELEKKVDHLQKVIQRQVRLGRMID